MRTDADKKNDASDTARRGRYAGAATAPSDATPVGVGGVPAERARPESPLRQTDLATADCPPVGWGPGGMGAQAIESPQASPLADRRGYGRIVNECCGSDASLEVGDSRDRPQASSGGSDDNGGSIGDGSHSAGIGRRFAKPDPIGIPPKLYRIGEIVEHSGLSRQTIHNYTTMGLLNEVKRTRGGHRLYDESVFERLNGVIAMKAQHKSLAYIREYYAKLDAG